MKMFANSDTKTRPQQTRGDTNDQMVMASNLSRSVCFEVRVVDTPIKMIDRLAATSRASDANLQRPKPKPRPSSKSSSLSEISNLLSQTNESLVEEFETRREKRRRQRIGTSTGDRRVFLESHIWVLLYHLAEICVPSNWPPPVGLLLSTITCLRPKPVAKLSSRSKANGTGGCCHLNLVASLILLAAPAGHLLNNLNVAKASTMSISSHHQPPSASAFSGAHLEPEAEANKQQQTNNWLHIQADAISARGALAFHKLSSGQSQHQAPSDDLNRFQTGGQHQNPANTSQKCQTTLSSSSLFSGQSINGRSSLIQVSNGQRRLHSAMPQPQSPPQVIEVLAIEGSSLRLNFVITGQQLINKQQSVQTASGATMSGSAGASTSFSSPPMQPIQLKVSWSHLTDAGSSQLMLTNSGDATTNVANNQLHQISPSGSTGSKSLPSNRVSSYQLAYEQDPETIKHLLGQHPQAGAFYTPASGQDSARVEENFITNATTLSSQHNLLSNQYILAPYVASNQLARLELGHLSPSARQTVSAALRGANQLKSAYNLLDDFLGDGQTIDWSKLGAYLRHLWSNKPLLGDPFQCAATNSPTTDEQLLQQQQLLNYGPQQLLLVQLEFDRLTLSDRGQYQLNVCQLVKSSASSANSGNEQASVLSNHCPNGALEGHQLIVSLQLAEDVPRLESWFEPQLLEAGDRLSIKCEATGFTLPQISWFLDGQQLSESSPVGGAAGGSTLVSMSQHQGTNLKPSTMHSELHQAGQQQVSSSSYFRIGDYVSQDNHVHSFVNSSSLKPGDGGYYKCQANNGFHQVEHEARIDVRGVPVISRRLISNLSALIGTPKLDIQCPYSGYPIASIEWFFKPIQSDELAPSLTNLFNHQTRTPSILPDFNSPSFFINDNGRFVRARPRRAGMVDISPPVVSSSNLLKLSPSRGDDEQQQEPDSDEWLEQAVALTASPPTPDDYPDPLPDDPAPVYQLSNQSPRLAKIMTSSNVYEQLDRDYNDDGADLDQYQHDGRLAASVAPSDPMLFDYLETQMDFQQQQQDDTTYGKTGFAYWNPQSMFISNNNNDNDQSVDESVIARIKRSTLHSQSQLQGSAADTWIKLPQSRRHQVHLNGTLTISDINRQDYGLYRCQVNGGGSLPSRQHQSNEHQQPSIMGLSEGHGSPDSQMDQHQSISNELQLNVLVPPTISPFASSDSLREGMRNFLSCSVIEGDPPVRLHWLKDGRPLEDYILMSNQQAQQSLSGSRIRVETSNEYTSTIYFSQVEFDDNGNYTCIATNKAASVNYTTKMLVNVPPRWVKSPKDVDCVAGQSIVIDCQAEAHPSPRIWWEIGLPPSNSFDSNGSNNNNNKPQQEAMITNNEKLIGKLSSNSIAPSSLPLVANRPSGSSSQTNNNVELMQAAAGLSIPSNNGQFHHLPSIGHHHPPTHYKTIISNSRIHILENASLVIRDISKQDQGYYLCQASNNFGLVSSLIKLTVNVGASFSSKYLMKYVKLNERVELDCEPSGQSPVTVTWLMRSGNNLQTTNTSGQPVSFNTDHQYHQSVYQQQQLASNQSLSISDGRRLFVGSIKTLETMPSLATSSNVAAMAAPSASSQTNKQQQQQLVDIDSNMSFEVIRRRGPIMLGSEFVRMHIKQARRSHSGDYVCLASNQFGSDEKLIKLLVQEPPDPITELNTIQKDSRSISLAWSVPFNGNSPISSYLVEWAPTSSDGQPIVDAETPPHSSSSGDMSLQKATQSVATNWAHSISQQPAITIGSLLPLTSYEFRIRARNQFGLSAWPPATDNNAPRQGPFVVSTGEEAPGAPPDDVRVVPMSSTSLQVSWLAPPPIQFQSGGSSSDSLAPTTATLTIDNKPTAAGSIKGYYLGYRAAGSNESFIFKTVTQITVTPTSSNHNTAHHPFSGRHSPNGNGNSSSLMSMQQQQRLRANIDELRRATRYAVIVQAFNSAGPGPRSDEVEAKTLIADPPPAPQLRVGMASFASIELQWSFQATPSMMDNTIAYDSADEVTNGADAEPVDRVAKRISQTSNVGASGGAPPSIDGYHLYYRAAELGGEWQERKLSPETHALVTLAGAIGGGNNVGGPLSHMHSNSHHQSLIASHQLQRSKLNEDQQQLIWTLVELQAAIHQASAASSNSQSSATLDIDKAQLRQQLQLSWQRFANQTSSEFLLQQKTFKYLLDQLNCGTAYQIYLVAYNAFGTGEPSHILRAKTRGSTPIKPQRQEFLVVNSTQVQLNLEAWLDGGCSVINFEIRYKQLVGGQAEALALLGGSIATTTKGQLQLNDNQKNNNITNWLLLSSNISPMQRSIELRDLQPETWYAILASAESSAGKTDAHYAFMTLDRRGQTPSEALELQQQLVQLQQQQQANNNDAPALIRGGSINAGGSQSSSSSFRSILLGLNQPGHSIGILSPLLISACLCVILFAICSLLLIRRYNTLIKDNISIDSRTTSGALSSVAHFGNQSASNNRNYQHQQQHLFTNNSNGNNNYSGSPSGDSPINHQHLEHYSLKVSPCKAPGTLISSTINANNSQHSSSSNSNGSNSAAMLLNGSICGDSGGSSSAYVATTTSLNLATGAAANSNTFMVNETSNHTHLDHLNQQHQVDLSQFLLPSDQVFCQQSANNTNYSTPADATINLNNVNKFATLSNHHHNHHAINQQTLSELHTQQQHECNHQQPFQQASHFKTLPHLTSTNTRTASTYLPTFQGTYTGTCPLVESQQQQQQQTPGRPNVNICQEHQHSSECQQQTYAKLRSIQQHQQQIQYATNGGSQYGTNANVLNETNNNPDSGVQLQVSANWQSINNSQQVALVGDVMQSNSSQSIHNHNQQQHLASLGIQNQPQPIQNQQQQPQTEQDDYALPFPPKWV